VASFTFTEFSSKSNSGNRSIKKEAARFTYTLKMEVVLSSETLVIYHTARLHMSENSAHQNKWTSGRVQCRSNSMYDAFKGRIWITKGTWDWSGWLCANKVEELMKLKFGIKGGSICVKHKRKKWLKLQWDASTSVVQFRHADRTIVPQTRLQCTQRRWGLPHC
jgi:hypothetical protein